MRRIIYSIIGIIGFAVLTVAVYFTSEHFAQKWESQRILTATLKDSDGQLWKLTQLNDKIGILYFGYTYCPDVCPTALNDLAIALDGMGADRKYFKPIFVSVDPDRDTPDVIKDYTAHFDKDILGLTGTEKELKAFTYNFGASYSLQKKSADDKEYIVNHTGNFFLVMSDGRKTPLPIRKTPEELREVLLKGKKRLLGDS